MRIQPNMGKVIVWTVTRIAAACAAVIGLVYLFKYMAGFSLIELAGMIGMQIDSGLLVTRFFEATGITIVLLTAFVCIINSGKSLETTPNSLKVNGREVPFDNIAKLNYDNRSVADKLLAKGTIILELTGVNQQKIAFDFVDEPAKVVVEIQQAINVFKGTKYTQYVEQQRVSTIISNY